jgi:hypothetical protein
VALREAGVDGGLDQEDAADATDVRKLAQNEKPGAALDVRHV